MPKVFEFDNFKDYLRAVLHEKRLRNPSHSLRAFARDLSVSASRLSHILNTNEGISTKTAHKICSGLNLSVQETNYFINLLLSEFGRTNQIALSAKSNLKYLSAEQNFKFYRNIKKQFLKKWYILPLIELIALSKPYSVRRISKILETSESEIQDTLNELELIGVLKKNNFGRYAKQDTFYKVEGSPDNNNITDSLHKDFLKKSMMMVGRQPKNKVKFLTSCLTISDNRIPEFRAELDRFLLDTVSKYSENGRDFTYVFAVQFYNIDSTGNTSRD